MTRSRLTLSDGALGELSFLAPLIGRASRTGGSNPRLMQFSTKNH
jgi:hypothetical protein